MALLALLALMPLVALHAAPSLPMVAEHNEFRVALTAKLTTLDPTAAGELYSRQATQLFYETLFEYHYLKRPYQLTPGLAEKLPTTSADFKRFTVQLRKKVFFHDDPCFAATHGKGREMTSADVVYMFERMATRGLHSPYFDTFEHIIEGIDDFYAGKAATISGVRTTGLYSVELRLTRPHPRLADELTDSRTSIIARECVEFYGDKFATHPVGTGPFLAREVELHSKIVGVKNPNYHHRLYPADGNADSRKRGLLADANHALPFVDKVVFEILPEAQPRWLKFMAGQLDMTTLTRDNIPVVLDAKGGLVADIAARGLHLEREPHKEARVFIFNMLDAVWGRKKELRQAFALALDIPKIIERLFSGQAVQLESIIASNMYGFDPGFKSRWGRRNLSLSKALLAKAGFAEGKGLPALNFSVTSESEQRQFFELVAQQLREAGIPLELEALTFPVLVQRLNLMKFGVSTLGFITSFPDADDSLGRAVSQSIGVGGNTAGYKNPEVDRLGDEIAALSNGKPRMAKIHRFQQIMDEDLPYVPLLTRIDNQLTQPWVQNHAFTDDAFLGTFIKYHRVNFAGESY
ncbi:MAG: hypothetical protein HY074_15585 [Deltaproteobacteria bacterium]|nr:hypothetical protein [Deltaproteobacteria bacterium]